MPRTKAFDVTDALDKAKDYFWAHGYESTSMDDLLKAMGINRGSFYDTYADYVSCNLLFEYSFCI